MAIIVTVLRVSDSTVTHADRAPNLMSAMAMAAAARKGMNMGAFQGWWRTKKRRPGRLGRGCSNGVTNFELQGAACE